jgi:AbrB family looped-hinge helix DNA binding protein
MSYGTSQKIGYGTIADRMHLMDATIQVRKRGTLTLPAEVRERYNIKPGDIFRLLDLDGIFVLTPMVPMVPELAREIERARLEAGLSVEEMLKGLREQRERYVAEKYGDG